MTGTKEQCASYGRASFLILILPHQGAALSKNCHGRRRSATAGKTQEVGRSSGISY
ncbi:MAG: hypothetical protein HXK20_00390 [Alloprevotella tannerae]|nr:hypothetical protein [Alloprevotella tannerae]